MTRNQFQDIVPGAKRSIRDIPLTHKEEETREKQPVPEAPVYDAAEREEEDDYVFEEDTSSGNGWWKWALGVVALLIIGYFASFAFHHATVTITPRAESIAVDGTYAASTSPAPDQILFDTVVLSDTASKSVAASGTKQVAAKAFGTIVIYNNFSAAAQELVANTRFASPQGKIYRIDKAVVVPGQKTVGGKTVPGSIEATVTADQPGADYNIEASDFTIPGFKGSPKYQGFYGRGNGAIAGGFVGQSQAVDSATQAAAETELKNGLAKTLQDKVRSQIPSDFVLLSGASDITYKELPIEADGTGAKVSIQGSITAHVFKRTDLETTLASSSERVSSFDDVAIAITDASGSSISFAAKGQVEAHAKVDTEKLKTQIAGKQRSNILAIIASYPEINKAEIKITPPWLMSLPKNPENINIVDTSVALTNAR